MIEDRNSRELGLKSRKIISIKKIPLLITFQIKNLLFLLIQIPQRVNSSFIIWIGRTPKSTKIISWERKAIT